MLLLTVSAVLFAVLAAICVFLHCVWLVAGEEAGRPAAASLAADESSAVSGLNVKKNKNCRLKKNCEKNSPPPRSIQGPWD